MSDGVHQCALPEQHMKRQEEAFAHSRFPLATSAEQSIGTSFSVYWHGFHLFQQNF